MRSLMCLRLYSWEAFSAPSVKMARMTLPGLVSLRQRGDAAISVFDGAANGIQQSGAAAWGVGGGGELRHILNGHGRDWDFVSVIKLDEREVGIARDIQLAT
jgi:hypothetical protein